MVLVFVEDCWTADWK